MSPQERHSDIILQLPHPFRQLMQIIGQGQIVYVLASGVEFHGFVFQHAHGGFVGFQGREEFGAG